MITINIHCESGQEESVSTVKIDPSNVVLPSPQQAQEGHQSYSGSSTPEVPSPVGFEPTRSNLPHPLDHFKSGVEELASPPSWSGPSTSGQDTSLPRPENLLPSGGTTSKEAPTPFGLENTDLSEPPKPAKKAAKTKRNKRK